MTDGQYRLSAQFDREEDLLWREHMNRRWMYIILSPIAGFTPLCVYDLYMYCTGQRAIVEPAFALIDPEPLMRFFSSLF